MKLRLTPQATRDLAAIGDYLREINPAAALRVRAAILETFEDLSLFPRLGRRQTTEGVRKIASRRYPYLVYYTIDEQAREVVVIAIRHPAREREFDDA